MNSQSQSRDAEGTGGHSKGALTRGSAWTTGEPSNSWRW
jgi:hypothetical protein